MAGKVSGESDRRDRRRSRARSRSQATLKPFLIALGVYLASLAPAPAALLIRELFDGLATGGNSALRGVLNGPTTLGFDTNAPWQDNYTIYLKCGAFDVTQEEPDTLPGLPATAGDKGGVWSDQWVFANPWEVWNTRIWVTRPLAPEACLNFATEGVYYFSVRLNNAGDSAGGIGFASAGDHSARFVGAGLSWDTVNHEPANYSYICQGSLKTNTPYSIQAHGPVNQINGKGLLVGRLTTHTSDVSTLEIKVFLPGSRLPVHAAELSWDTSYTFHEQMLATHLLLWMNGTYPFEIDAIRVGTTYSDVVGLEILRQPQAFPSEALYPGATLTNSVVAAQGPLTYQWRQNGYPLLQATSSELVLPHLSAADNGDYDVVVTNPWGTITSTVVKVSLPAIPVR
ncbi:MAG TPA: hypothetical protein VNT26_22720 [Candidatus Sulfotelmatobacter sp.]|nr:hypothetical protein [Candidatus Sulfotelmatobacter sp.]